MKRFGVPWQAGETLSMAIGQGYNLTTPLQIAATLSAMVNGGKYYQPRIVRSIQAPYGEVIKEFPPVGLQADSHLAGNHGVPAGGPVGRGEFARRHGRQGPDGWIRRGRQDRHGPGRPKKGRTKRTLLPRAAGPCLVCLLCSRVESRDYRGGADGTRRAWGATAAPVARKVLENYNNRTKKILPSHLKVAQETSRPAVEAMMKASDRPMKPLELMIDRRLILNFDWTLLITVLFISTMGVLNIYSSTYPHTGSGTPLFVKQIYWLLIGIGLAIFILLFDYRTFIRYAYPFLYFLSSPAIAGHDLRAHNLRLPALAPAWLLLLPAFGIGKDCAHPGPDPILHGE